LLAVLFVQNKTLRNYTWQETMSLDLEFKEFFSRNAIINTGLRSSHFTFKSKHAEFIFFLSVKWNVKSVTKRGNTMAQIWGKIEREVYLGRNTRSRDTKCQQALLANLIPALQILSMLDNYE